MLGRRPNAADVPGRYVVPKASAFSTEFRSLYDAIWEAEARFDLLFRPDLGVYVWAANRIRFYYELASKLGIYKAQVDAPAQKTALAEPPDFDRLGEFDAYIQTGALGPATKNRARPYGCVYTERYVRRLAEKGRRVLLLHDAPESLASDPFVASITSRQLQELAVRSRRIAPKARDCRIGHESARFWGEVDTFFSKRLGTGLLDRARVEKLIFGHKNALAAQSLLFDRIRPKAFVIMAHYFRAPQIEAAKAVGARVVDYQHGINSRYHLGYGFPNVAAAHRKIPYFPDEFWSWGEFWTDPDWFPVACCETRVMGHHQADHRVSSSCHLTVGQGKTLMIATSWAMQDRFREIADRLAASLPDWRIAIKLHPRETVEAYADIASRHRNVDVVPGTVDILEASRSAEVVVSICSSSLFDVLLNGCRLMVLEAPSVEYVEDFVLRFKVPVLHMDCSNLYDCLAQVEQWTVPVSEVFGRPPPDLVDIALDSITSPHSTASMSPPGRRVGTTGTLLAAWKHSVDGYVNRLGRKLTRDALRRASDEGDANRVTLLIPNLIRYGASTKGYRSQFLRALAVVERTDGRVEAGRRLSVFIKVIPDSELSLNLPVLEAAIRLGVADRLLARFHVSMGDRKWRTAAELLSRTGHLPRRLCDIVTGFAEACDREWMDTRVSPEELDRLFEHLQDRLRAGDPFALMRLGDGEVYGFDPEYVGPATLADDRVRRETIWWGGEQPETIRRRLREELRDAIDLADYLGIPSPFRLLRDVPAMLADFRRPIDNWHPTLRAHMVLLTELARMRDVGDLTLKGKQLVDDRCHQSLFTPDRMVRLLSDRRHVVAISCFDRGRLNQALGADLIDEDVLTPPHQKVVDLVAESDLKYLATPRILDNLYAQIDTVVTPGSVVLVAGGFVGKLLIARAKARGGMALDIGASPDYWIGHATRGDLDFTDYAAGM